MAQFSMKIMRLSGSLLSGNQQAEAKSTARQSPVDLGQAEGKRLAGTASAALQVRYALLKAGDNRTCRAIGHENPVLRKGLCNSVGRYYVLYLFSFGK
jgi:hypothetical protein